MISAFIPALKKYERPINVALRSATSVGRFLFIIVLAKYVSPTALGWYGLFAAAVAFCLFLVGMDFYTFSTREIIQAPPEARGRMIKGQSVMASVTYLCLIPIALAVFGSFNWPSTLLILFGPLLALEYASQEMSRILIAFSRQIEASILMFLRQGSWVLIATLLLLLEPASRDLAPIIVCWAISGTAAAIYGGWRVSRLDIKGWKSAIEWDWVFRGIRISATFLIGTMALRGIQTLDRYWLEILSGLEAVAAYALYAGISGALLVLLEAAIFSYLYPTLIRLESRQQTKQIDNLVQRAIFETILVSIIFSMASYIAIPHVLGWIGKETYLSELWMFPWLLIATIINGVGMVPHYALYAAHRDKAIVYSHFLGAMTFAVVTAFLSQSSSASAVPIGITAAFFVISVSKFCAYLRPERLS